MRFMLMVIPKQWGVVTKELIEKMGKFNQEMVSAGIVLGMDGLHEPESASTITFEKLGKTKITDGPFAEAKEAIGGYWIIQVKNREEALAWARRAPMLEGDRIEVRRIQDMDDPPDFIKEALKS